MAVEVQLLVTKKVGFGPQGELIGSPDARAAHIISQAIKHASTLDREGIDQWADGAMKYALGELARTAKEAKLSQFSWVAAAGPQGGGKGTQIDALTQAATEQYEKIRGRELSDDVPLELVDLVAQWANTGSVVTGTGGMMNKPTGEYAVLFKGIEAIAKKYADIGELVPAKFTGVMVTLLTSLRIAQGKTLIVGDLFPRDATQKVILDQITGALNGVGVQTDVSIVDFKLMSEDVVRGLNNSKSDPVEMKKWGKSSSQVGGVLKSFVGRLKKEPNNASEKATFLLNALAQVSPEFESICGEVLEAMKRVSGRVNKAGQEKRSDDSSTDVLVNRLASYLGETWPALVGLKETVFVSGLPKEDIVFGSFVMALLKKPELVGNKFVQDFISSGQKKAKQIVAKK